jgi:hypothetical protein
VNNTGGLLGSVVPPAELGLLADHDLAGPDHGRHELRVRRLPHELLIANDTPGIFYTWSGRTRRPDIIVAGWKDRNFVYYGGPNYLRSSTSWTIWWNPGATQCQVTSASTNWAGSSATATAPTARRRRTSTTCA